MAVPSAIHPLGSLQMKKWLLSLVLVVYSSSQFKANAVDVRWQSEAALGNWVFNLLHSFPVEKVKHSTPPPHSTGKNSGSYHIWYLFILPGHSGFVDICSALPHVGNESLWHCRDWLESPLYTDSDMVYLLYSLQLTWRRKVRRTSGWESASRARVPAARSWSVAKAGWVGGHSVNPFGAEVWEAIEGWMRAGGKIA